MDLDFIYNPHATSLKAISLFAGAGGCSLGFSRYGIRILSAYDICKEAVDTYNLNFPGNRCKQKDLSVCNFNKERLELGLERGSLDLIIGGPPCQGFTTAGKRDRDDPRNRLLENYVKALDIFYPRWFMMENVEGILTTTKGNFLLECVSEMIRLGYTLCIKKVYMQEFGIPQRRKRVIIIGNREGKKFIFPQQIKYATGNIYRNGTTSLRNAISNLEYPIDMNRQQREFYKQFSEHGSGDAKIAISPKEVLLILHIAYTDLYKEECVSLLEAFTLLAKQGFYHIPFKEIEALPEIEADLCFDIMTRCGVTDINNRSGQGRFKEEKTFPIEAQNAGYTPILVVFDGTESLLLTKLKRQYTKCGGKYFIGEDAWKILSERAGREMSIFINKYIYPPINDIEQSMTSQLGKIQLELRDSQLTVNNGTDEYVINRN